MQSVTQELPRLQMKLKGDRKRSSRRPCHGSHRAELDASTEFLWHP